MEIPIPHRTRAPPAVPEIYVQDSNPSDRFRTYGKPTAYNSTSSPANIPGPMSIPNAREPVPPPLPPPRHIGPDIAWQWANSHEVNSWGRSVAPGSSLYGSYASEQGARDAHRESPRRTSSTSTIKAVLRPDSRESHYPKIDEGYASLSGTSVGSSRLVIPFLARRYLLRIPCLLWRHEFLLNLLFSILNTKSIKLQLTFTQFKV